MKMTREELKAGVTPGDVVLTEESYRCPATDEWEADIRISVGKQLVCRFEEDCGEGDPALYAEAHNVANEHGMWPLDLVDRVKELEDALDDLDETSLEAEDENGVYDAVQFHLTVREEDAERIRAILYKTEPPKQL